MKILACSDLHCDADAAQSIVDSSAEADVIVGAGDFAIMGEGAEITLRILQRADKPLVVVSGNHDRAEHMRNICSDWDNVHFLHGDSVELNGVTFFGLGAETPCREPANWSEHLSDAEATEMLEACPTDCVLVTHTPPFGYADLQCGGTHEGSPAILATVNSKHPTLVLCGHIHNAWGTSAKKGVTRIRNLGPMATWLEL